LEAATRESEVKRLLHEFFLLSATDAKKLKILVNFHFHNYAFCKQQAFDARRSSTFMSIMNEIFIVDEKINSSMNSVELSFQRFKDLVLKHGVERPPKSVQIFREADFEPILTFVIERYFKNFKLYSYIFANQSMVALKQVSPNSTEMPRQALPLNAAFQLS
jgi:hypothetical protein